MYATSKRTVTLWGDPIDAATTLEIRNKITSLLKKDKNKWITLEVFSGGGDWIPGLALYHWLHVNVPHLQTVAYGMVASMAVVVYLAGKHRVVTPDCYFILHPARDFLEEPTELDIDGYKSAARALRQMQNQYNKILLNQMDYPPKKSVLEKRIKKVTAVGPKGALKWGLAHELWKA